MHDPISFNKFSSFEGIVGKGFEARTESSDPAHKALAKTMNMIQTPSHSITNAKGAMALRGALFGLAFMAAPLALPILVAYSCFKNALESKSHAQAKKLGAPEKPQKEIKSKEENVEKLRERTFSGRVEAMVRKQSLGDKAKPNVQDNSREIAKLQSEWSDILEKVQGRKELGPFETIDGLNAREEAIQKEMNALFKGEPQKAGNEAKEEPSLKRRNAITGMKKVFKGNTKEVSSESKAATNINNLKNDVEFLFADKDGQRGILKEKLNSDNLSPKDVEEVKNAIINAKEEKYHLDIYNHQFNEMREPGERLYAMEVDNFAMQDYQKFNQCKDIFNDRGVGHSDQEIKGALKWFNEFKARPNNQVTQNTNNPEVQEELDLSVLDVPIRFEDDSATIENENQAVEFQTPSEIIKDKLVQNINTFYDWLISADQIPRFNDALNDIFTNLTPKEKELYNELIDNRAENIPSENLKPTFDLANRIRSEVHHLQEAEPEGNIQEVVQLAPGDEEIARLEAEIQNIQNELEVLQNTSPEEFEAKLRSQVENKLADLDGKLSKLGIIYEDHFSDVEIAILITQDKSYNIELMQQVAKKAEDKYNSLSDTRL